MKRHHVPQPSSVGLALLALAGAAVAPPAGAANECKVEYGYHTGSGLNRKDETKTVDVDLGERKQVGQNNMNYVLNKKNQKVRVSLSGSGLPNPDFDLEAVNQRNPFAPLFYTSPASLTWLECRPDSPNQLIEAMKAANKTATQIAQVMKDMLGYSAQQAAEALKAAGYTAAQVAAALKSAFNASAAAVAQALKVAGYTGAQVAAALKSAFDATAQAAATALKAAFSASATQVAAWLEAANYTGAQVAAALKSAFDATAQAAAAALKAAFNATGAQVAIWLAAAEYTGGQIVAAMKSAFDATAEQAAQWTKAAVNASAQQMAQWLRDAGYTLQQVAVALESVDYQPGDIIKALKLAFGATADQIVALAKQLVLDRNCGAAGCDTLGRALKAAGYLAAEALAALRSHYQLTVQAAHDMMIAIYGLSGTALERALAAAGYTAQQIAQVIGEGTKQAGTAIGTGVAGAQRGVESAAASTMQIQYATLGVDAVRECNRYPAGRTYNPVPLPPGARDYNVTLLGSTTLGAATAVNEWPTGTFASIAQQGPCFLVVRLTIPASAREGTTGQAVVMAGNQPGPRLNWRVGAVPAISPPPAVQTSGPPITTCPIHTKYNARTGRCE